MTVVVHFRREPYDIYIGRPSVWGNPYSRKQGTRAQFQVSSRAEAIERYEAHVRGSPELLRSLRELRGKRLGCWCAPKPCHGDVLVKLVGELDAGLLEVPVDPEADIWAEVLGGPPIDPPE